jgi:chromate reductase
MTMNKKKIVAFSGSIRANATNEHILKHIAEQYNSSLDIRYLDIAALPFFNPDVEEEARPASVIGFCSQIAQADGVIICTPEYVFSLPGVLKNALEWTVATTVFLDKPTALITASGLGEKAHESLLLIMNTFQARIGQDAALLISGARSKVNKQGEIIDKNALEGLAKLMTSFLATIKDESAAPRPVGPEG